MKRQYRRLRIALVTFTLGLAAVRFGDGIETAWNTVNVDLPEARSDVLFVFPIEHKYMGGGGGAGGGWRWEEPLWEEPLEAPLAEPIHRVTKSVRKGRRP